MIPFTKAHGARNDFLLTWAHEAPAKHLLRRAAIAICDRHAGVGADGWLLVRPPAQGEPAAIRLFNSDGSEAEISGNGTRCAAAFLCDAGLAREEILIRTGAGDKRLRLLRRDGLRFEFEMDMGQVRIDPAELRVTLEIRGRALDCTLVWPGNPQCAVFAAEIPEDWAALGAAIESHPRFPNRTNVSFVKVLDAAHLEVRFYERGAGVTESSGTGSTGAFAAARARGLIGERATIHTPAGPLAVREEGGAIFLTGPAEIVAGGEFYFSGEEANQR
ncbi:MAG: diaminopimelate epimerase [Bryobacteraceae bacterium]